MQNQSVEMRNDKNCENQMLSKSCNNGGRCGIEFEGVVIMGIINKKVMLLW